ncbi:MAG: hypothetical protein KC912_15270 [Proteobacteria bacterium]|nr:hypothetical protein [Pseudomonadota bacterium]
MSTRTLYSDPSNKRFFHVPDSARIPAGDFVLRSLAGKKLEVAEASVEIFEIPEDKAKDLAGVEMKRMAAAAGRFASGAGTFLRGLAAQLPNPTPPPAGREQRRTTIADALGVTEEQLSNDPTAVIEGIKNVGKGLEQLLKDAVSTSASDEDVEARQSALVEYMREQLGDDAAVSAETLPETLRNFLSNPELEERIRDAAAQLNQASEQLKNRDG